VRTRGALTVAGLLVAAAPCAHAFHCPNVLFVLDRSGSMAADPNGGLTQPSKWELAVQAIGQVLASYGDRLPFGLEMFTADPPDCYPPTAIDVQPGHGTQTAIANILALSQPAGGTNTGEAILRAATDCTALHDASRGDFMVLVTDGDPNCDSQDQLGAAAYTVSQIAAAAAMGIHTYVIGFDGSGGVNPDNLNRMAQAGLEPVPGCLGTASSPCYYSASNAAKFVTAMMSIVEMISAVPAVGCDDSCLAYPCAAGQACVFAADGAVCQDEGCLASGCPDGRACMLALGAPTCVLDPCASVSCPAGDYCRNGRCLFPCPPCADGQACVDGHCVNWPCSHVSCAPGWTCDGRTGSCVVDRCVGRMPSCLPGLACDPATGGCVDDPCRAVACPTGTSCRLGGSCEQEPPPDGGATDEGAGGGASVDAAAGGGGGGGEVHPVAPRGSCALAPGGAPTGPALLVLLAVALAGRRRSRSTG
jgi:hypothetical protein